MSRHQYRAALRFYRFRHAIGILAGLGVASPVLLAFHLIGA